MEVKQRVSGPELAALYADANVKMAKQREHMREDRAAKGIEPRKRARDLTPKAQSLEIKTMVLSALQKAGGETWLVQQAQKNPLGFMALLGKVMAIQAGRIDPEQQQINVSVSWLTGDRLAYQRQAAPLAPRVDTTPAGIGQVAPGAGQDNDLW